MRLDSKLPHLPIWGEAGRIPGNTGKSKRDVMNIDKSLTMEDVFTKYPGIWDKSTDELGDLRGNDYMVWDQEMEHGYAEETYSDVPLLIPFLSPGSDRCVILCPGGAYLTKSMDSEGQEVAEFLNAAGISAFVLWYRSYPYRAPLMYLDAQRAVRYVRFHAAEYGLNAHKIGLAGFSAGGNLAGVEALCFREAFADRYDLRTHVQSGDAPAFLCACADDFVVPPPFLVELQQSYAKAGVSCELHLFPYGGHGFGACIPRQVGPFAPPDMTACRQWKELFCTWVNGVFDGKLNG